MYDLANQSFTLLINTLLFPVFFREVIVGGDPARGDRLWSAMVALSMLIVVVVSPLIGALADVRGLRKKYLIGTGLVCGVATCILGLLGGGAAWIAFGVYLIANIAFQLGENFLASFLPFVSNSRTIGRVSAIGWTMGYIGALLLLVISLLAMWLFGWMETSSWRPLIVFAGVWFLLGIIPPMVVLPEPPAAAAPDRRRGAAREALRRVRETWTHAGRHGQLMRFFGAFFLFGMGVQTVVFFAGIVAKEVVFKDDPNANLKLVLFIGQLTITAGIAAALSGRIQDRIGARTMVIVFLSVWIVSTLGFAVFAILPGSPEWAFWLLGNGVGFALGGIGTSSRSLVGRFTPEHKTAEFFGLWGTVFKGAGVVGVFAFGQVKAAAGDLAALGLLTAFFAAGLAVALTVRETRGVRAAKRADRDWTSALELAAREQIAARGAP